MFVKAIITLISSVFAISQNEFLFIYLFIQYLINVTHSNCIFQCCDLWCVKHINFGKYLSYFPSNMRNIFLISDRNMFLIFEITYFSKQLQVKMSGSSFHLLVFVLFQLKCYLGFCVTFVFQISRSSCMSLLLSVSLSPMKFCIFNDFMEVLCTQWCSPLSPPWVIFSSLVSRGQLSPEGTFRASLRIDRMLN